MPTAIEELQLRIENMLNDQLKNQHALGSAVAEYGGWTAEHMTRWPRELRQIEGRSLLVESVQVRVHVRFFPVEDLGSFPIDQDPPLGVEVQVYTSNVEDAKNSAQIPYVEIEAWARATLGRKWSERFYYLSPEPNHSTENQNTHGFIGIIDHSGEPRLAPDNFDFNRATTLNLPMTPIFLSNSLNPKAEPLYSNFSESAPYRDPATNPNGTWKINILNQGGADENTLKAIKIFLSFIQTRGSIDSRFKPISIEIEGNAAKLRFEIIPAEIVYCYTFNVPDPEELDRGVRISHPSFRIGKMVHTKEEWAFLLSQKIRREFPHIGKVDK